MSLNDSSAKLREDLQRAGLSRAAINAAWPSWWNDEAEQSASARAELRFALARKLGLAPKSLIGERVDFVWKDRARFKHLGVETETEQQILSSFAMSVGKLLTRSIHEGIGLLGISAADLRASILANSEYVDLRNLIAACWSLGIPVIHLRVFPLATKAMHAMVVGEERGGAIMLGRDASYPAPLAFTLAHEIGHLALGHVSGGGALVDLADPVHAKDMDQEEAEADAFALTLLTGSPAPEITTELQRYNAPTLAKAVLDAGPALRIEPGTLALCVGHIQKNWQVVMSALGFIYAEPVQTWRAVNRVASRQIDWSSLSDDDSEFLQALLRSNDG